MDSHGKENVMLALSYKTSMRCNLQVAIKSWSVFTLSDVSFSSLILASKAWAYPSKAQKMIHSVGWAQFARVERCSLLIFWNYNAKKVL